MQLLHMGGCFGCRTASESFVLQVWTASNIFVSFPVSQGLLTCDYASFQKFAMFSLPCRNGTLVKLPESDQTAPTRTLAFDPAGKWLLAAGDDKIVKVWKLGEMTLHCQWYAALNSRFEWH